MLSDKRNTERMGNFLAQISAAHPDDFMIMIVDGASSHIAKALVIPDNIPLCRLPPCSPQLNPQEFLWDDIREKQFPNRIFDRIDAVRSQFLQGLTQLDQQPSHIQSICA